MSSIIGRERHKLVLQAQPNGATAVKLFDANTERVSIFLQNVGAVDVFLGDANVTNTSYECKLAVGDAFVDESTEAWYAVTTASAGILSGYETTA